MLSKQREQKQAMLWPLKNNKFLQPKIENMKKLFIKSGLLLILFSIMILPSCQKQSENNLSAESNTVSSLKSKLNVDVENGIVVFKNFGNYNSTIQTLSHLNGVARTDWANSLSALYLMTVPAMKHLMLYTMQLL